MKTLPLMIATAVVSLSVIFGPDIRMGVNLGMAQAEQEHRLTVEQEAHTLFQRECSFPATWEQDWCRTEYVKRAWLQECDGAPCAWNDPRLKEPLPSWLQERPETVHQ